MTTHLGLPSWHVHVHLHGHVHEHGHVRILLSTQALSMGTHESQSLLWERMVLQSEEFWTYAAPLFHERFKFTAEATPMDFYKTYNRVAPGD